jgi:hypothetical protein
MRLYLSSRRRQAAQPLAGHCLEGPVHAVDVLCERLQAQGGQRLGRAHRPSDASVMSMMLAV